VKGVEIPTARVHVKGAADRFARFAAVVKHHSAAAGRTGVHILRGLFTAGCGFGLLGWMAMHATTPHHYEVNIPHFQMPQYDLAKMERELSAIERLPPVQVQLPPLQLQTPKVVLPVMIKVKAPVVMTTPVSITTHEHAPGP